jgi:hypothetical protein
MTEKGLSRRGSLSKRFENLPQRFTNLVLRWWEKRGNRVVSIETINVLVMFFLFFLLIASTILLGVTGDLVYLSILQRPSNALFGLTVNFVELLAIFLAMGIVLLYLRRIKQYTFKHMAINRVAFLKWDSRSRYFQWTVLVTYQIMFLTTFAYTFITSYLKTPVTNQEPIALPLSIFFAVVLMIMIIAIFLYLTLSLGMNIREKAAFCFDYLSKIDDIRASQPRKIPTKDVNYMCETGVRKLDRLILFDQYIGDELNLGPSLSNVFLGLFWGDNAEKQRSKDLLRRMRDVLLLHRPGLSYRLIVRNLIEFHDSTPNLSRLQESLSLNILPVKRTTTLRKLSENSALITLFGVCIALISFIASRL